MSSWTHHRARVAALSRDRAADDPEIVEARRSMRAEKLADHIRSQVDAWPPLTPEQRYRLAVLLRGGAAPDIEPARRPIPTTAGGGSC